MGKDLHTLRDLTYKLPPVRGKDMHPKWVEYKLGDGVGFGYAIHNEPTASAQHAVMSAGSVLAKHKHEGREWLIVHVGKIKVNFENGSKIVGRAEHIVIECNQPHWIEVIEDTRLYGISIPPAEGYPDARRNE